MADEWFAGWHAGTDEDGHMVYDGDLNAVVEVIEEDGDKEREQAIVNLIVSAPTLSADLARAVADRKALLEFAEAVKAQAEQGIAAWCGGQSATLMVAVITRLKNRAAEVIEAARS